MVNFAVDPRTVAFEKNKEDGLEHAELSCIAWAFPVKGKPIGSGGGTVNAKLDDEIFKKVMQSALPCRQSLIWPREITCCGWSATSTSAPGELEH